MARLYFDHNFTRHVAPSPWAEGHDLLFTRDRDMARLTDDAHLLASARAGRVLVTHDRHDFRMLHDAWITWPAAFGMALPRHSGIVLLDSATPEMLARVLIAFLRDVPAEALANAIFWWHRHEGWRQPVAGANWEPYQSRRDHGRE